MNKRVSRKARKVRKARSKNFILKFMVLVLLIFIYVGFVFLRPKYLNGQDKLVMAVNGEDGVYVSVFDPGSLSQTNIFIPKDTQVSVAGELGSWKIGSVWQLGVNEKMDGGLLARTVSKNFGFPVVGWAGTWGLGFVNGHFRDLVKSVFSSYQVNLTMGDRLRLAILVLKIPNEGKDDIDLAKSPLLKKTRFLDGGDGFVISGKIPEKIAAIFPNGRISKANLKAKIVDSSERSGLAEKVGNIIETMGVKVAVISKDEKRENFDCRVSGIDKSLVLNLSRILGCSENLKKETDNFDLEVVLGSGFPQKF
jgi:hypothetical protein